MVCLSNWSDPIVNLGVPNTAGIKALRVHKRDMSKIFIMKCITNNNLYRDIVIAKETSEFSR